MRRLLGLGSRIRQGEPEKGDDVCSGTPIKIAPGVRTDTLKFSFHEVAIGDSSVTGTVGGSLNPLTVGDDRAYSLIALEPPYAKLRLPGSVTAADLRARIDSIRSAH